jgi:hypothetical protein
MARGLVTGPFICLLLLCSMVAQPLAQVQDTVAPTGLMGTDTAEIDLLDSTILEEQRTNAPPLRVYDGRRDDTDNKEEFANGFADGRRAARGNPLWVFAGLAGTGPCICFGVAGVGISLTIPYTPPEDVFLGRSSPYIAGYYKGYRSKSRQHGALWAALGLAAAVAIDILMDFPTSFGNVNFGSEGL